MKYVIGILVIALLVAHQDYWNWSDKTMVFGFLPMGLFYHCCISLAAGLLWFVAVTFAWPKSFSQLDAVQATEQSAHVRDPSAMKNEAGAKR